MTSNYVTKKQNRSRLSFRMDNDWTTVMVTCRCHTNRLYNELPVSVWKRQRLGCPNVKSRFCPHLGSSFNGTVALSSVCLIRISKDVFRGLLLLPCQSPSVKSNTGRSINTSSSHFLVEIILSQKVRTVAPNSISSRQKSTFLSDIIHQSLVARPFQLTTEYIFAVNKVGFEIFLTRNAT